MEEHVSEPGAISDAALLASWAGGDQRAAAALIERHFASLHRYLRTRVARDEDVEDLVQQTLLACVEAHQRYRQDASFKVFLLGIARHKLYGYYRERQRCPRARPSVSSLRDPRTSPTRRYAREQQRRSVDDAFRSLSPDAQQVLELAYGQELAGPELAQALGVPLNTAYSRLRRARRALLVAFERHEAALAGRAYGPRGRSERELERVVRSWRRRVRHEPRTTRTAPRG